MADFLLALVDYSPELAQLPLQQRALDHKSAVVRIGSTAVEHGRRRSCCAHRVHC
jgi:hypothetical protein